MLKAPIMLFHQIPGRLPYEPTTELDPILKIKVKIGKHPGDLIRGDPILQYDQIPGQQPWVANKGQNKDKDVIHNGQMKLFLTEVQHATEFINPNEEVWIMYAGSAPSNKLKMHMDMFTNAKYILIDPNEFNVYMDKPRHTHYYVPKEESKIMYMSVALQSEATYREKQQRFIWHYLEGKLDFDQIKNPIPFNSDNVLNFILNDKDHRVYIFNEYFTKDLGKLFNEFIRRFGKKILFWSDIRSNTTEFLPGNEDTLANSAMTYVWLNEISREITTPIYAMLKFKAPYNEETVISGAYPESIYDEAKELGYDPIGDIKKEKYLFIPGEIYIQAYPGKNSTESRLWSVHDPLNGRSDFNQLVEYSMLDYDEVYSYYNKQCRFKADYDNKYASRKLGFDNCADCSIAATICEKYFIKFDPGNLREKVQKLMADLAFITRRSLNRFPHGTYFYKKKKIRGGNQRRFDPTKNVDPNDFIPKNYLSEKISGKTVLTPRIKLSDIPKGLKYSSKVRMTPEHIAMSKVCHNGQVKLFLTELQHLKAYLENTNEEVLVIYAGAAPSNKAYIYGKMFPNVKFIFIDPNEFNIYFDNLHDSHYYSKNRSKVMYYNTIPPGPDSTDKYKVEGEKTIQHYKNPGKFVDIQSLKCPLGWEEDIIDFILDNDYQFNVFQDYFTESMAIVFNKLIKKWNKKVLFWSDVRTNMDSTPGSDPTNDDIVMNTAMNYTWLKRLVDGVDSEFYSMLKFRLPYGTNVNWDGIKPFIDEARNLGFDFEKQFEDRKCIKWFKGDIYLQAYAGYESAESRLWSTKEQIRDELVEYPLAEHEEKLHYYNMVERFGCQFENELSDREIGFDHCGDCAIMANIWEEFATKFGMTKNKIKEKIILLGDITGRPLARDPHGHSHILG